MPETATTAAPFARVARPIWFAFVQSSLIIGALPFLVAPPGADVLPASLRSWAPPLALAVAAVSFAVRRRWTDPPATALAGDPAVAGSPAPRPMVTGAVVTWALCELVAILGLAMAFLTGDAQAGIPYAATGIVLLVLHRPALWQRDDGTDQAPNSMTSGRT